MNILKNITSGLLLIIIGVLHTQLGVSSGGFGKQVGEFSKSWFFNISPGINQLPAIVGKTNFEHFAAFWFVYFGLMIIPFGILIHLIEKKGIALPLGFTISYLIFILIGCYMVPNSGMTFIMLPHALFMLIRNILKSRKITD